MLLLRVDWRGRNSRAALWPASQPGIDFIRSEGNAVWGHANSIDELATVDHAAQRAFAEVEARSGGCEGNQCHRGPVVFGACTTDAMASGDSHAHHDIPRLIGHVHLLLLTKWENYWRAALPALPQTNLQRGSEIRLYN